MTSKIDMKLKVRKIDGWTIHAMEFENDKSVIMTVVREKLANIQTKRGRLKRLPLQQQIAIAIRKKRGLRRYTSKHYVISLGMRFSIPPTQKQPIDIDNFIKPIFAGIACGLFISSEEIPTALEKFKEYDDSHFDYLFVERLDPKQDEEGVAIVVSEKPS